ncbi:MAG: TOBE domain-containing protein [Candidatus Bathyarchaeota archaeon]|nr:TOBE domain-containing protein [Candidatus Bathyarchaeota archaeon]
MSTKEKHKPSCKVWIEHRGKPVLGKGGAEILRAIARENSLSKAAEELGMSYRYLWNYVQKIQKAVEAPIVATFKGGKAGGGGARLTELGESLLHEYERLESYLSEIMLDMARLETLSLNVNVRNRLKGKVTAVEKNEITTKIKVEITMPATITALISNKTAEELDIKVGDEVEAVVKTTDVIIEK